MDELQRLKQRRRRRQEAFTALGEIEDRLKSLALTFEQVEDLALTLKAKRFLFFTTYPPERAALLTLADSSVPLLEDIAIRVHAIQDEFSNLQHSDDRERIELEAILTPKPTR